MRNLRHATVSFSNPSRCYEEMEQGVRFWGYDQTIEISFLVKEQALRKIKSETQVDEAGFLSTFDRNLDQIRKVAGEIYSGRPKTLRNFSFTLTESDF